ncbi:Probable ATP-dependent RNA helicase spindle-E [Seminavis robusta]|uniref:Probable ATP-dependent RNA helicase spindle-E n=1 Tax=Seminavis robusta TaxID=568900 RepID=A0A9N8EPF3_9STRA|nr:Probable ATP-dependent RNA helicase spindle-E [Seminavis robusta]|eukprot:Sro1488_g276890.1 Probable ATP-dependent RNA helicase spindle-E (2003) ;mRNA; r:15911-22014
MGVQGITKLLTTRGVLPPPSRGCCTTELFQQRTHEDESTTILPEGSTLLIDGPGLAFYLHTIAYSRWARKVTQRQDNISSSKCRETTAKLTTSQLTLLLPQNLPKSLLVDVTREFVHGLSFLNLKVYWDGPSSAAIVNFKATTLKRRREQRETEWSNLQRYCDHGIFPNDVSCQVCHEFPYSQLFVCIVRETLRQLVDNNIECDGEADAVMAADARDQPDHYVVGQDSDFFFYKGIQYIPFAGLVLVEKNNNQQIIRARVYTRQGIAQSLGLEDGHMTELACMLGNDYVDATTTFQAFDRDYDKLLDFLAQQEEHEYRHTTSDPSMEAAIQYSRILYNHGDMQELELPDSSEEEDSDGEQDEMDVQLGISQHSRTLLRRYATLKPDDTSVREAWLRSLQEIVDATAGEEEQQTVFNEEHLKILQQQQQPQRTLASEPPSLDERPTWQDMLAATFIEKCAMRLFQQSRALKRTTAPGTLFDHAHFFQAMAMARRKQAEAEDEAGDTILLNNQEQSAAERLPTPVSLPIDAHRDVILESIRDNRVTIIHGETGCGKSSRVPIMILEAATPDPSLSTHKLFISQPRRIAAKALVERVRSCEPQHAQKFALRMGHGWREYESSQTQAWFVTTGYLTRLLANHPQRFDNCTHLVIDEVHERSVDTDILCFLCRRLLEENKRIRLVLMSATLATKLYKEYFNLPNDPIHVGVRRYPIEEVYLEDLSRMQLTSKERQAVAALSKECDSKKCKSAPGVQMMKHLQTLAANLATMVGDPGSSVLIFVAGMAEIIGITELVEGVAVAGKRLTCFPIHSDIPFEDQMSAFDSPEPDEVKIIIATNAAESSVTLPDVDHVICLGLCRQIVYNASSHRQMLTPTWISRASAKQRAGRTGRVRPGTVYRLYSRNAFDYYMDEFEPGEMVRIPLDSVILMLKEMLHESITPVLLDCLEPPNTTTIERSFESLHQWKFITSPDDDGEITDLGSFVSSLGMDLMFGNLIGLGIQFGVAAEAIEMASVMSFPKTPFQITSPLIHSPAEFNEISAATFVSRSHWDANLYSDPLAMMNLMWEYERVKDKKRFCGFYRVAINRFRQMVSTKNNKRKRVAEFLGIEESKLKMQAPPVHLPASKLAILRILQLWVFSDMMIEAKPVPVNKAPDGTVTLKVTTSDGRHLSSDDLKQILDKQRHPFRVELDKRITHKGSFQPLKPFELPVFEERFLSYCCVHDIGLAWYFCDGRMCLFFTESLAADRDFMDLMAVALEGESWMNVLMVERTDGNRRGISERTCGTWMLKDASSYNASNDEVTRVLRRYEVDDQNSISLVRQFSEMALETKYVFSKLEFTFSERRGGKKKKKAKKALPSFVVCVEGSCSEINKVDMFDLLQTNDATYTTSKKGFTQNLSFDHVPNNPKIFGKSEDLLAVSHATESSSWKNPLFADIPESARLITMLASGQRKGGQKIVLQSKRTKQIEGNSNFEEEWEEEDEEFDLNLGKETRMAFRWKRLSRGGTVYVPENCVPAVATSPHHHLFACCANALEVGGGGLRVDCLTLLPTDPLFVALGFLSFGLQVPGATVSTTSYDSDDSSYSGDPDDLEVSSLLLWIGARCPNDEVIAKSHSFCAFELDETMAFEKIKEAIAFHRSCSTQGESLLCFPSVVIDLCKLFDGVGGRELEPWNIAECSLTANNLKQWRRERKTVTSSNADDTPVSDIPQPKPQESTKKQKKRRSRSGKNARQKAREQFSLESNEQSDKENGKKVAAPIVKSRQPTAKEHGSQSGAKKSQGEKTSASSNEKAENEEDNMRSLASKLVLKDKKQAKGVRVGMTGRVSKQHQNMFVAKSPEGETVLVSTNVLAMLLKEVGGAQEQQTNNKVNWKNWKVLKLVLEGGETLYRACFETGIIPLAPVEGRGKNLLPKWMRKQPRPVWANDALECIPPATRKAAVESFEVQSPGNHQLWFRTIDAALRMEAAFWLERQFSFGKKSGDNNKSKVVRHWYDQSLTEMAEAVKSRSAEN